MKQLVFYALFWLFSGGLYLRSSTEGALQQTFSKPHVQNIVTTRAPARLKDIDVMNPLFIFK